MPLAFRQGALEIDLLVARQMGREFVAALSVLLVVLLSLSPADFSNAQEDISFNAEQVSFVSICGDGPGESGHAAHSPCHACNPSSAAIPAPPRVADLTSFGVEKVNFSLLADTPNARCAGPIYAQRGPPTKV